jgi:hypothetical protein
MSLKILKIFSSEHGCPVEGNPCRTCSEIQKILGTPFSEEHYSDNIEECEIDGTCKRNW